jgi:hypothetical protein
MRLGYSFWGFLGDLKLDADGNVVSSPDGNATYSWSILHEAQRRGWLTVLMQKDRDYASVCQWNHGPGAFSSFSSKARYQAWLNSMGTVGAYTRESQLPDLDVLLVEWRWPIPGRNFGLTKDDPDYQPDYDRQTEILEHYKSKGTKVLIWDLDQKLTCHDELRWKPDAILETSALPCRLTMDRIRVEPPIVPEALLQFKTLPIHQDRMLSYVGSRYERDEIFERYVAPVARRHPGKVHVYGKWEPREERERRWPGVVWHGRIDVRGFRDAYGWAAACPLLAKPGYLRTGFVTPRPWEAIMFGTIPVALSEALGARRYAPFVATDGEHMADICERLAGLELAERDSLRREWAHRLGEICDVRRLLDIIEGVVSGERPTIPVEYYV